MGRHGQELTTSSGNNDRYEENGVAESENGAIDITAGVMA